jgi:CRISPR-associated endonuclease Csn1
MAEAGTILGLDVGANSVGWSLVETSDGHPSAILAGGVRCFAAGVEGQLDQGREESRSVRRRQARQIRRQTWRRQRRQRALFSLLQRNGLLPETPACDPSSIHECLRKFDAELRERSSGPATHRDAQVESYRLRERAAREPVSKHELGRALYHLAQRRGYLSNRRHSQGSDEDDRGQVEQAIASLDAEIRTSGAPTLGAYLASLDPDVQRIRGRWTSRAMYVAEFERIWTTQAPHDPELTPDLKRLVYAAIFRQRPLRDQSDLIGGCELEKGERRAPKAHPVFQRFRLLQTVGNLRVQVPGEPPRPLSADERRALTQRLEGDGDLTKTRAKEALGLPSRTKLSIEEGGETKLVGNRTASSLRRIFGDRWGDLEEADKAGVLEDLLSFEKSDALRRRAERHWRLPAARAKELSELQLEEGYASLSAKAMLRLLPHLEAGTSYAEAVKTEYPNAFAASKVFELLPPVRSDDAFPALLNPTVLRSLSEVRRVVNAIVRRHGKPDCIRIELARDLKRGRKQRRDLWRRAREQEAFRKDAAARIARDLHQANSPFRDIEKVMLAMECNWRCPYTGAQISMRELLGDSPSFDVDHIIPFSRSLDDSFANKTLCRHEENRNVKRSRTPFEAYSTSQRWEEILDRVRRFQGRAAAEKLRRFQLEQVGSELSEEFTTRHLNDTRHASVLAAEYVGRLYGGAIDASGRRRVQVTTGRLTAFLRSRWDLNKLLGDGGEKARSDHRHHFVDALVVALTDAAAVKLLAGAAQRADDLGGRRLFAQVEPPWDGFNDDAREMLERIVVSHRVSRRLNGPLHEETLYGPPRRSAAGGRNSEEVRHVRKPVDQLSRSDLDLIADPVLQERVRARLEELGKRDAKLADPKRAFADASNHPFIEAASGRRIPVHRVRIRKSVRAVAIGTGPGLRHVAPGSNHHMAVVAVLDDLGATQRWEAHVVTRLEAMGRLRRGDPVVRREWGPKRKLCFSLTSGDTVRLDLGDGAPAMCLVRTVSGSQVELTRVNDARPATEIRKAGKEGGRLRFGIDALRQARCEKVDVMALGDVIVARD